MAWLGLHFEVLKSPASLYGVVSQLSFSHCRQFLLFSRSIHLFIILDLSSTNFLNLLPNQPYPAFVCPQTTPTMDMSNMDHSGSSDSSSSMSMTMTFMNAHDTPLFATNWTPSSSGSYAGSCIFLIVLSIIARLLAAFKAIMETHWLNTHLNRRYVAVAGKTPEVGRIDSDPETKSASLVTAQGVEESVRVVRRVAREPLPWRFSVDLPRAFLFLLITGVSYLLYVFSIFWQCRISSPANLNFCVACWLS